MNTKTAFAYVVAALLPLPALAQGTPATTSATAVATGAQIESQPVSSLPPAAPAPDAVELTKLLHDFLSGASRNDVAMHERFWADDVIYTSSSGTRRGKAEIMRNVREEAAPKDKGKEQEAEESAVYTAEDIRIQQYETTAIVAFRLVGTTKKGDSSEIANYLNSGTFLKRDGKWQVVNWHATKMPSEPDAKK